MPRRDGDRSASRSRFFRQRVRERSAARDRLGYDVRFGFIDLFAGIGGIRLAVEDAITQLTGGLVAPTCLLSSEWDRHCQQTYLHNFGEVPHGDVNRIALDAVPRAAMLVGGFPCQPFSSIGRREGFDHKTQGNLFFRVVEILRHHRRQGHPIPALLLENVEGLLTLKHDGQLVIDAIEEVLRRAGYKVEYGVLDAADFGVPQHRRRVFIVGLDAKRFGDAPIIDWQFPAKPRANVGRILETGVDGYSISRHLQSAYIFKADDGRPQRINRSTTGPVKTLVSTYHKIQRLTGTFVEDGPTGLRLLTRDECRAIMGFPKTYEIPPWISRTQAYRQFGNSVAPPVVREVARRLVQRILEREPSIALTVHDHGPVSNEVLLEKLLSRIGPFSSAA